MEPERPKVVVVNDNPEFLAVMDELLSSEQYDTSTVDGDKADAVARITDARPDLLIIDLRLGADGLHGWDIVEEVRKNETLSSLPILVCSGDLQALQDAAERIEAMTDVETLVKPFALGELFGKVESLLGTAAAG